MYRILIVEDDSTIAEALKRHLEGWDHETVIAEDFKNIMAEFTRVEPDLVLLDIGLPFYNGFYWCSQIRQVSDVPIIFISSASDNMNIVMAMNMGGDEFIEKPFDLHVVTAKVQAILRRAYSYRGSASLMEYRGCILNLADATVTYQNRKTDLTKNEFKIFQCLLENAGKIVTRDEIIARLWESDAFIDENTLTVNVARLRKKLAQIGLEEAVVTKKGIGYMVEA
ncbi:MULTISPECIES: response regulator transcription factor [Lachnospiraceae]|jgi:DNA-binding response OmpR family regulator|uniref:Stage 0 sporulation protein A homolog n=1 Tax=Claveliimonas monacensis TaxID=2779351 RepID=A0ABR9RFG0_9FIRM|nr:MULTISPECIES: response regulator transcription factor [Lachnospiraceae]MBE5061706.1 response regulator transcription factor [Claveliimonas monacensis]MBM6684477.1 response regulator transcription factor [Faecalicatena contorta]MBM6709210.1 response regulator transcription factor [Faecalicatena contorta]OUQ52414.1 DNA-binding response regulator [Lachnoclostridium sp. An118]